MACKTGTKICKRCGFCTQHCPKGTACAPLQPATDDMKLLLGLKKISKKERERTQTMKTGAWSPKETLLLEELSRLSSLAVATVTVSIETLANYLGLCRTTDAIRAQVKRQKALSRDEESNGAKIYTAAEDEIIEDALRANKPRRDIVELLPGRSLFSVKKRIQKLRKPKKPKKPKNLTVVTDSGVTLALRNPCSRSPNFSMQVT